VLETERAVSRTQAEPAGTTDERRMRPYALRLPSLPEGAALLGVPAILLVLFLLLPLIALVWETARSGTLPDALRGPVVWPALRLSLETSAEALAITVALGTPLAYALARISFPGRRLVETLVDLPLVLPPVVAGVALLMAFGRRGLLAAPLHAAGIDLAFTTQAVVLAQVFISAPYYVRSARTGFASVEPELEEVARTLGATRLQALRYVTLPLAAPALASGAVLCWARAMSEFGATMMFAGNFPGTTRTASLAIMTAFNTDLYAALALGVVLLAVAAGTLLFFRLLSRDGFLV
jgi:molybdate transport system permease protein